MSDVIAEIKAIVDEYPDNTAICNYATLMGDGPSCIVGFWMHRRGTPVTDLHILDVSGFDATVNNLYQRIVNDDEPSSDIPDSIRNLLIDMDPRDIKFLNDVQRKQDCGLSWSEAFDSVM